MLSEEKKAVQDAVFLTNLNLCFGQEAFDALTEEEKVEVDFFIRAGCCTHKELNSVKGGNACKKGWSDSTHSFNELRQCSSSNVRSICCKNQS